MTLTSSRARGFTLIELMIAVAIVALLASVAYPSYVQYVAKGRRADAKQALLELAQTLERFYTERGTYAGAALGGSGVYPAVSSGGYYTMAINTQTADGFTISATPRSSQTGDACAAYQYNQAGEKTVSSAATLSVAQCW